MRCPKCSFISFDVLETCVKCGKNISKAAEELQGTIAAVIPPEFLKLDFSEEETTVDVGGEETEEAFDLGTDDDEVFVDFSGGEDAGEESVDVVLDEEPTAEEPVAEEPVADVEPVADEEPVAVEELSVEETPAGEEVEVAVVEEPEPAGDDQDGTGSGLEDLKVDIDLDASAAPAETGKVMPSVKTGTALDDFDIDLGDLLPKQ